MHSHIDLTVCPRVTYFFGVPGAGKSFCAEALSNATGVHWYEADSDLPDEIREAVANKMPFTEEQRDRLYAHIGGRILELLNVHSRIIVSQATFKQRHRNALSAMISGLHFIWVNAPKELIATRLRTRGGPLDADYGLAIAKMFEPPDDSTSKLFNDGSTEQVLDRLIDLFTMEQGSPS